MRITDIRALILSAPLPRRMGGSGRSGPLERRGGLLVEVHTDAGLVGLGEALTHPEVGARVVSRILKPMLLGTDPEEHEPLWDRMYFGIGYSGMRGFALEAISAVDIALWDLCGQAAGKPVCELLGPVLRRECPAYAAGLYFNPLDEILDEARDYVRRGFRAVKMKIGQGLDQDPERVAAVRAAIGPEVELMVDANCRYTAPEAIALAERIAPYRPNWFEEPVIVEDLPGYRAVREGIPFRVAGGEGEATRWGFEPLLATGCVDVVQPDLMRAGGFTECLRISRIAERCGVAYSPHNWGSVVGIAASLHLAAVLPTFEIFEYEQFPFPLRDALALDPPRCEAGVLKVPSGPGLGIHLNPVALGRYLAEVE